jgi:hypothetical protein
MQPIKHTIVETLVSIDTLNNAMRIVSCATGAAQTTIGTWR